MELMDLPPEILHLILYYAALSRGCVKRAVRLRLVCKDWAVALYDALFETHLMDKVRTPSFGSWAWHLRNQHGADKLWHRYLVYRVHNEQDPGVGRYVEMRQVAQAICRETNYEMQDMVEAMCRLASEHYANTGGPQNWGPMVPKQPGVAVKLGTNMIAVATYLNNVPLVERLLDEAHSPELHDRLFSTPLQIAAQTGNTTMLRLFQRRLSEAHMESCSIVGAAIGNDLNIAKLALRTTKATHDEISAAQKFGSISYDSELGKAVLRARRLTSSPDMYDYLTSALAPWPWAQDEAYSQLRFYARLGKLQIVQHLLDLGVPIQKPKSEFETPLVMACIGRHEDMVQLLLDRGADVNFTGEESYPIYPLHLSTTADSLPLTTKLLDHGAEILMRKRAPGTYPALWWAFARENIAMIRFLQERGASFDCTDSRSAGDGWAEKAIAEVTHYLGYDSMGDLIRVEYGIALPSPVPSYPTKRKGKGWHLWPEAAAERLRWI